MIWALVAALLVAALLGAGAVVPVLARRPARLDGARARARSAHARLTYAVQTSGAGEEQLAAATERLTTCGGLLARAGTMGRLRLAEQVAEQGLAQLGEAPARPAGRRWRARRPPTGGGRPVRPPPRSGGLRRPRQRRQPRHCAQLLRARSRGHQRQQSPF